MSEERTSLDIVGEMADALTEVVRDIELYKTRIKYLEKRLSMLTEANEELKAERVKYSSLEAPEPKYIRVTIQDAEGRLRSTKWLDYDDAEKEGEE